MKIKICGLNPVRDVQLCIDLKVNFLGFVFYEKSPRNLNLNEVKKLKDYNKKSNVLYAASQLWVDAVIDPIDTRNWISMGIDVANHSQIEGKFNMGILQV